MKCHRDEDGSGKEGDDRQPGIGLRVEVEDGPHGARLTTPEAEALTVAEVREVTERERR